MKIQKYSLILGCKQSNMKLTDAKLQFIASWGAFGTHWGINRTMAQIHALLLVSADPLTQDELMEQLNISRGNVNMNIRELIDWALVDRVIVPGERKEYFSAEKDIWKVARLIIKERKKREPFQWTIDNSELTIANLQLAIDYSELITYNLQLTTKKRGLLRSSQ